VDERPDFKSFKEEALKNAKVRKEYEALRSEFELIKDSLELDKKNKRTVVRRRVNG